MLNKRLESRRKMTMRSFLVACLAAILIASGAAIVLNNFVPNSASSTFSTQGVRI